MSEEKSLEDKTLEVGQIYTSGKYLKQHPTWHAEDSPWKAEQIRKVLERNQLHPNSICEVGCGAGEILNQLYLQMPNNVSFIGYEISEDAFNLCQPKKKERLDFKFENILEDENAFFDLVLAMDVVEHVDDYLGFLRGLSEKGMYNIFHLPLDISVQAILRHSVPILNMRERSGHLHYFTKETALETLKDTGYEILDYFYTPSAFKPSSKQTPLSTLAKWPRRIMYALNEDMAVRTLGGYSLMVLAQKNKKE